MEITRRGCLGLGFAGVGVVLFGEPLGKLAQWLGIKSPEPSVILPPASASMELGPDVVETAYIERARTAPVTYELAEALRTVYPDAVAVSVPASSAESPSAVFDRTVATLAQTFNTNSTRVASALAVRADEQHSWIASRAVFGLGVELPKDELMQALAEAGVPLADRQDVAGYAMPLLYATKRMEARAEVARETGDPGVEQTAEKAVAALKQYQKPMAGPEIIKFLESRALLTSDPAEQRRHPVIQILRENEIKIRNGQMNSAHVLDILTKYLIDHKTRNGYDDTWVLDRVKGLAEAVASRDRYVVPASGAVVQPDSRLCLVLSRQDIAGLAAAIPENKLLATLAKQLVLEASTKRAQLREILDATGFAQAAVAGDTNRQQLAQAVNRTREQIINYSAGSPLSDYVSIAFAAARTNGSAALLRMLPAAEVGNIFAAATPDERVLLRDSIGLFDGSVGALLFARVAASDPSVEHGARLAPATNRLWGDDALRALSSLPDTVACREVINGMSEAHLTEILRAALTQDMVSGSSLDEASAHPHPDYPYRHRAAQDFLKRLVVWTDIRPVQKNGLRNTENDIRRLFAVLRPLSAEELTLVWTHLSRAYLEEPDAVRKKELLTKLYAIRFEAIAGMTAADNNKKIEGLEHLVFSMYRVLGTVPHSQDKAGLQVHRRLLFADDSQNSQLAAMLNRDIMVLSGNDAAAKTYAEKLFQRPAAEIAAALTRLHELAGTQLLSGEEYARNPIYRLTELVYRELVSSKDREIHLRAASFIAGYAQFLRSLPDRYETNPGSSNIHFVREYFSMVLQTAPLFAGILLNVGATSRIVNILTGKKTYPLGLGTASFALDPNEMKKAFAAFLDGIILTASNPRSDWAAEFGANMSRTARLISDGKPTVGSRIAAAEGDKIPAIAASLWGVVNSIHGNETNRLFESIGLIDWLKTFFPVRLGFNRVASEYLKNFLTRRSTGNIAPSPLAAQQASVYSSWVQVKTQSDQMVSWLDVFVTGKGTTCEVVEVFPDAVKVRILDSRGSVIISNASPVFKSPGANLLAKLAIQAAAKGELYIAPPEAFWTYVLSQGNWDNRLGVIVAAADFLSVGRSVRLSDELEYTPVSLKYHSASNRWLVTLQSGDTKREIYIEDYYAKCFPTPNPGK